MRVSVVRSIRRAKQYFDAVIPDHSFQSYAVQCAIEKSKFREWIYSAIWNPKLFLKGAPAFRTVVVFDDCGRTVLVAPIVLKKCCECTGKTHGSTADYVDFLYADVTEDLKFVAMRELMTWLADQGCETLCFEQLAADSQTLCYVERMGLRFSVTKESSSVCINLGSRSYEEYFSSLRKHAKQNVRTAYNRLARNGLAVEFKFYSRKNIGDSIDSATGAEAIEVCEKLYYKRQSSRYYSVKGFLRHLKKRFVQKYLNYTTLAKDSPDLMLAVLTLGGDMAAFMRGYFKHDMISIELPRLAINDKFGWYSPGLVLLNEAAKFFISSTHIKGIDLCRGAEKYKTDMGGGGMLQNLLKSI